MPVAAVLVITNTAYRGAKMLHIHFGTGRLGLGLVAPFFQSPDSELYLLNRAVSGNKATGSTELSSERRNELLSEHPEKFYVIQELGETDAGRHLVYYDKFFAYDDDSITHVIQSILEASTQKQDGVIVTASVLKVANYRAVTQAMSSLVDLRERQQVGPL